MLVSDEERPVFVEQRQDVRDLTIEEWTIPREWLISAHINNDQLLKMAVVFEEPHLTPRRKQQQGLKFVSFV